MLLRSVRSTFILKNKPIDNLKQTIQIELNKTLDIHKELMKKIKVKEPEKSGSIGLLKFAVIAVIIRRIHRNRNL